MASGFKHHEINLSASPAISSRPETPIISSPPARLARPSGKRKKFSCFFIFLIIFFTIAGAILSAGNNSFLGGVKNSFLVRQITHIIYPGQKYLAGEKDDRINMLLVGMGGEGHNGPYLTDTIIIASFKPSTKEAALFSIPRDTIVRYNSSYHKINEIYTIGKNDNDAGGKLMKQVVSDNFGLPIHYFGAVDFQGFVEIIDSIDGIKVNVDKSFTDYQFPTADYKVQTISFKEGSQKMDGITALRYARSRHGNNGEGSDFARIKRQQKIILAAKDKVISFNTWINPKKIVDIFSLISKYTQTDMEPWEAVKLVHLAKGLNTQNIITQSIDDRPGGYLKAGIAASGAYILQPNTGNYDKIKELIANIFTFTQVPKEDAKIVIQNGTNVEGLALKAVNYLNQMGYNVLRYGNDASQNKISTVIYGYADNKPHTKESLENIFQTKIQTTMSPEYFAAEVAKKFDLKDAKGNWENIDFLIILGLDQQIDETKQLVPTIDPSLYSSSTATSTVSSTPAFDGIIN